MALLRIWVPGVPAPGGSKKAIANKANGKTLIVDDGKRNRSWKAKVRKAAQGKVPAPLSGPLVVSMLFILPRPRSHYRTGRFAAIRKDSAPASPIYKPDVIKLARSTEDALTDAGVWGDDAQTIALSMEKRYGPTPGALVSIFEAEHACEGVLDHEQAVIDRARGA